MDICTPNVNVDADKEVMNSNPIPFSFSRPIRESIDKEVMNSNPSPLTLLHTSRESIDKEVMNSKPSPFSLMHTSREAIEKMYKSHPDGGKCDICLKDIHWETLICPYMRYCPPGTLLGKYYVRGCRHCGRPYGDAPRCTCGWADAEPILKRCYNCSRGGICDHITDDCPNPRKPRASIFSQLVK